MKFTFIEKKMAPSDSLRAYAEKKVSKIDRLFRTESEANVTFSTERPLHGRDHDQEQRHVLPRPRDDERYVRLRRLRRGDDRAPDP